MILASSKSNSVMSAAETNGTSPILSGAIVFFDSLAPEAVPPPRRQILMRAGIRPFAVTFAALLRLVLIQWPSIIEKQDTGKDQSIVKMPREPRNAFRLSPRASRIAIAYADPAGLGERL
jgi:hypothetical protein